VFPFVFVAASAFAAGDSLVGRAAVGLVRSAGCFFAARSFVTRGLRTALAFVVRGFSERFVARSTRFARAFAEERPRSFVSPVRVPGGSVRFSRPGAPALPRARTGDVGLAAFDEARAAAPPGLPELEVVAGRLRVSAEGVFVDGLSRTAWTPS